MQAPLTKFEIGHQLWTRGCILPRLIELTLERKKANRVRAKEAPEVIMFCGGKGESPKLRY